MQIIVSICLLLAPTIFSEEETSFEVSKNLLKEVWPQVEEKANSGVHLGVHSYVKHSANLSGLGVETELYLMVYKTNCKLNIPLQKCKNISAVESPFPASIILQKLFEKKKETEIIDFKLLKTQSFVNDPKTIDQMLTILWSKIEAEAGFKVHLKVKTIGSFLLERQLDSRQSMSVFVEVIKSNCNIDLPFDCCEDQELVEENAVQIYAAIEQNKKEKDSYLSRSQLLGLPLQPCRAVNLKKLEIIVNN